MRRMKKPNISQISKMIRKICSFVNAEITHRMYSFGIKTGC